MSDSAAMRIWHQSFTVLEDLPDYAALLQRHADEVVGPDTSVVLHGMRPGTYPSNYPGDHIRYSYFQRRHTQQFVDAALQAQDEGFDAFLIATIPDIGLEDIRTLVDIPVIGFGQASLLVAATIAPRVGIVNFIKALGAQLRRNADSYGLGDLLGPVVQMEGGFNDVLAGYQDPAPLIEMFRSAARQAIAQGACAVIPGEAPLNVFLADHGVKEVDGIPVIDSLASALKFCELRVELSRSTGLQAPTAGGLYHDRPPRDLVRAVNAFYDTSVQE